MKAGVKPIDLRFKKPGAEKKVAKPECPSGNCKPHIITVEDILAASVKPEISGAEAIAPLFEDIIGSLCEGNSCDACNECNGERKG